MKKVLVIAPYSYLPFSSGGQKFIAKFLEYLGEEVDLTVVSVPQNDFSLAKNYKALPLLQRSFFRYINPVLVSKLAGLVKREGFDTVIWEHPYYAWAALLLKKQTGIKTIIHSHNIEYQRFRDLGKPWWPVLKRYEKMFFRFADYIFFITPIDRQFAIEHWKIPPGKCIDVPFGIELNEYPKDREECKQIIKTKHGISNDERIILFNGVLNYKPNLDALILILQKINPVLLLKKSFRYQIIICGKNLPLELNNLVDYKNQNIIYAGFVDDIDTYFKAADIFLNPVQTGGGIKTKMVEAIGFGTTVIATESGARGIKFEVAENKLAIVQDNDWTSFVQVIIESAKIQQHTTPRFYEHYYYGSIIANILKEVS